MGMERAELLRVAVIQSLGHVELGVAQARCVRTDATDAVHPIVARFNGAHEMIGMGTVHHVVDGCVASRRVDAADLLAQELARGDAPIRLDRERDHDGQTGIDGALRDPDGLIAIGHGYRRNQIDAGVGQAIDLRAMYVAGLSGLRHRTRRISVARRSDDAV